LPKTPIGVGFVVNLFCRSGQYNDAVEHYTVAVELSPLQIAAYTNRAACYLKLCLWDDALVDCDMALMLLDTSPGEALPPC